MERQVEGWQIKAIYVKANALGIKGNDHTDVLHCMVEDITGKTSIKSLSFNEADVVIKELKRKSGPDAPPKKKEKATTRGGVTSAQQDKIWRLMYELEKYDTKPAQATIGKRLCGLIKKQCGIDAPIKQPFRFLNQKQGSELIDTLRTIVTNAELKKIRSEG